MADAKRPAILGWRAALWSGLPITDRLRSRHLVVIDVLGLAFASFLALAFRFDSEVAVGRFVEFAPIIAILVLARVATDIKAGLYNRGWRMASVPELERILIGVVAGTLVAATVVYAVGLAQAAVFQSPAVTDGFPRSFWISEMLVSLAILGGVRFTIRAAAEREQQPGASTANLRRTLLYGAGRTGHIITRSALRNPDAGVLPVGYLDDDPALEGKHMGNLRVFGGVDTMERAIAETGAEVLLITMPRAQRQGGAARGGCGDGPGPGRPDRAAHQ